MTRIRCGYRKGTRNGQTKLTNAMPRSGKFKVEISIPTGRTRQPISDEVKNYKPTKRVAIVRRDVSTVGYHVRDLAALTGWPVIPDEPASMKQYKSIIYIAPLEKDMKSLLLAKMAYPKLNVVLWWIGTDATKAKKNQIIKQIKCKHLCVSNRLQAELKRAKIRSDILTLIPPPNRFVPRKIPKKYTVAVYMPSDRLSFHKFADVREIMRATPNTHYLLYGCRGKFNRLPKNAEVIGWVNNVNTVLQRSNCLLRLTEHDGFPKSIIEAVLSRCYVITNYKYPMLPCFKTNQAIIDKIRARPVLPMRISHEYRDMFSKKKFLKQLRRYI